MPERQGRRDFDQTRAAILPSRTHRTCHRERILPATGRRAMKAQLVLMSCILGGLSCSYSIHQVHCSGMDYPVPSGTGRPVEVVVEERVILGFAFDTEYVERAYIQLQEECPRGSLQAITTRYS